MDFKADIRQHFKIELTNNQMMMFDKYYNLMIEYNKHTNLTTITDKDDAYYKHFYDSLTLIPYIKDGKSICDMGSGAGFPSIPLKIIYPNLEVTIIDSSNKRIKFLEQLVTELKLDNVTLIHDRIEVYSNKNNLKFDYVTARALGKLNLILEMAIPMLKNKGYFLAMKGDRGILELTDAKQALKTLNALVTIEAKLILPHEYGERYIFLIETQGHVKGYPREYKQMLNKPL